MSFIKSLLMLIVIPVFGFSVSYWVIGTFNDQLDIGVDIGDICSMSLGADLDSLGDFCRTTYQPIAWMQSASIASAIVAIVLLLSYSGLSKFAGKNRKRIATIFPTLVTISLIVLSGQTLIQGAILTYGAYVAESTAIGRVHFVAIGIIGLGALLSSLLLIVSTFKLSKKQSQFVMGESLNSSEHDELKTLVDDVAQILGAVVPSNIVVGLDPNFWVTNAEVNTGKERLQGESLYLSLPLMRILTKDELKAIIGHELGHFRGDDTYYSLRFAPVYAGLNAALSSMTDSENESGSIATFPAVALLNYMKSAFHQNISVINREREHEADLSATEVAPPEALATALLKLGLYADAWNRLTSETIERMQRGKITTNLSKIFQSASKYDVNKDSIPEVIGSIASQTISHPTDSHPTTSNRISALGLSIKDIDVTKLVAPLDSSISLINSVDEFEERLTLRQQQLYVALGVKRESEGDTMATIIASFGAHMVLADGEVLDAEIDNAESMGRHILESFDYIEFREFCLHPEQLLPIDELLTGCSSLTDEQKEVIVKYLELIAASDGDLSKEEEELMGLVTAKFRNNHGA
jgi:Zn-dependent protease with chaperone function